ncbi:putative nucleoredoxin 1 [Camellia lanceoleosa]|nr:putative nucleoredoxin 1 [Camellia lanceoleosa]
MVSETSPPFGKKQKQSWLCKPGQSTKSKSGGKVKSTHDLVTSTICNITKLNRTCRLLKRNFTPFFECCVWLVIPKIDSTPIFENMSTVIFLDVSDAQIPLIEYLKEDGWPDFSMIAYKGCLDFTTKRMDFYRKLKEKCPNFEIVSVSLDEEEESFKQGFDTMWPTLPFKDKSCDKLIRYLELRALPILVIISPDGNTLNPNVAEFVEEHGVEANPFSPEKVAELAEIEKAKLEAQTLESILVSGENDFVIEKSGSKWPNTHHGSCHCQSPLTDAYPSTEEHLKKLDEQMEEMAKGWPEKLKHELHVEHELTRIRRSGYVCNGCREMGHGWSFYCKVCDFDLHPKCALMKDDPKENGEGAPGKAKEGWTCEGGICWKT